MFPLGNVWPVGDSITWGVGGDTGMGFPGGYGCAYRDPMYAQQVAWGGALVGTLSGGQNAVTCPISGVALLSDGWSGYKCSQISAIVAGLYGSISVPRVVLLMIGTNDMIAVLSNTETMLAAQAAFTTLLDQIVALDTTMTFFVSTMLSTTNLVAQSTVFNNWIAQEVERHKRAGRKAYLVDMYPVLDPATDYDAGGVHPNVAGYAKMATKWQSSIRTLQP